MIVRLVFTAVYNGTLFPLSWGLYRMRLRRLRKRPRTLSLRLRSMPGAEPASRFARDAAPPWPALLRALDDAARADGVSGLFVSLDGADGSLPDFEALRSALTRFRATGKSLRLHFESLDLRGALLATAADRVTLAPGGSVHLRALSGESRFYGAALARLGLHVDTARVGAFKGFVEPFSRADPTPEFEQAARETLDDLGAGLAEAVRDSARAAAATPRDDVPARMCRQDALDAGLVDALGYRDEEELALARAETRRGPLQRALKRGEDTRDPELIPLGRIGLARPRPRPLRRPGFVAIAAMSGMIVEDAGGSMPPGRPTIAGRDWAERLDALRQDPQVQAVVLAIDSRGGSASASDRLWHATRRLAATKPTVAWLGDVAASGGYYLACGANHVIASPFTITGSIGVAWLKPSAAALARRVGVRVYRYGGEPGASLHSATRALSDADREGVERSVVESYERFLEVVAASRSKTRDEVHAVAQGRVWTGRQAHARGLVDELGAWHEAEAWVRAALKWPAAKPLSLAWAGGTPSWQRALALLDRFSGARAQGLLTAAGWARWLAPLRTADPTADIRAAAASVDALLPAGELAHLLQTLAPQGRPCPPLYYAAPFELPGRRG